MNYKKTFFWFSYSYIILFLVPYAILPLLFAPIQLNIYVSKLISITLISILFFLISLNTSIGFKPIKKKLKLGFSNTIYFLFFIFLLLAIITYITAPKIPILEALKGASEQDLVNYREGFLKGRRGIESILVYLMDIICAYFIPFFIIKAYIINHKYKFLFITIFFVYSISFLEKAYFLKIAIPFFIFFLIDTKKKIRFIIKSFTFIFLFFILMYTLSGASVKDYSSDEPFFSISYSSTSIYTSIIWRAIVIPIITSLDAIRVFMTEFNSNYLFGSTSSFISFLTGMPRVNFERYLYESQFGGGGTGNANQFYLIEAYINFGFFGVIIFSIIVGRLIRSLILNNDLAVIAILPLFLYNLFNAGLIGGLLSNGFLFFFIFLKLIKFK